MPTWLDTRHGSSGSKMQLNLVIHSTNDAMPLAAPTEATQLVLDCTRRGHDRQSNVAAFAFHSLEQHLPLQLHIIQCWILDYPVLGWSSKPYRLPSSTQPISMSAIVHSYLMRITLLL
jgi:hypothetical protein